MDTKRIAEETRAGDPFVAVSRRRDDDCPRCFGGYVTLAFVEDDETVTEQAVPCRRCNDD